MRNNKAHFETDDFVFDQRLYVIFLIIFTEVIGFTIVLPIIPFLGLSLGLTPIEIGLIASVFSFCQLFASPITGKLSDRFGRKPLFVLSQLSTFAGFSARASAVAKTVEEARKLIESGFEYVCTFSDIMLYRKRK